MNDDLVSEADVNITGVTCEYNRAANATRHATDYGVSKPDMFSHGPAKDGPASGILLNEPVVIMDSSAAKSKLRQVSEPNRLELEINGDGHAISGPTTEISGCKLLEAEPCVREKICKHTALCIMMKGKWYPENVKLPMV